MNLLIQVDLKRHGELLDLICHLNFYEDDKSRYILACYLVCFLEVLKDKLHIATEVLVKYKLVFSSKEVISKEMFGADLSYIDHFVVQVHLGLFDVTISFLLRILDQVAKVLWEIGAGGEEVYIIDNYLKDLWEERTIMIAKKHLGDDWG